MKIKILLGIILSSAFLLRVLFLDVIPYGFTPDEASFGYDAYSIILTGKDQWGHALPLVLESFGDFKMPLYSYIAAPFIYVLGLSKFAIRFPNALLGTAAVYVTYLLVRQLFENLRMSADKNSKNRDGTSLGILAATLLAINPWHVMMSRGAFEANLTTFLMPLASYFFIRGVKEKKYLIWSAIVFGLNLFSYHSARLVTPLLLLILIVIYSKDLLGEVKIAKIKDWIFKFKYPIIIFSIFLAASFYTLTLGAGTRAKDITIFSGALEEASGERFISIYQGLSIETARLFHNKYFVIIDRFLSNYLQYISPNFLFINGPAEASYGMMPGRGVLYWFELVFLLGFLYSFIILRSRKAFLFILIWILLSPIPAALTTGKGFAGNRAIIMQPALSIALSMGAYTIFVLIKQKISVFKLQLLVFAFSIICLSSFIGFVKDYFIVSPYKYSKEMLYGNLEVARWLKDNADDKKEIVVSKSLSEPHIYVAYANLWNPTDYQNNSVNWQTYRNKNLLFVDQLEEYKLGKYTFKSIDLTDYQNSKDVLIVGKPDEFPSEVSAKLKFFYPNGDAALIVVEPFQEAYAQKNF